MSNLITVIYTCGHKSLPHERRSTGVSDPDPTVCECEGCWEEDVKDLSTLPWTKENPKPYWCLECQTEWKSKHGYTVDVIQTHSCGCKWIRPMNSLHFLPSQDGKYYSKYPGNCLDCYEWKLDDFMKQHLGRGRRYHD